MSRTNVSIIPENISILTQSFPYIGQTFLYLRKKNVSIWNQLFPYLSQTFPYLRQTFPYSDNPFLVRVFHIYDKCPNVQRTCNNHFLISLYIYTYNKRLEALWQRQTIRFRSNTFRLAAKNRHYGQYISYTRYSQRFVIYNQSFYNNSTRTSRQTVLYTFLRIFRRVCIPRNVSLFAANVSISNKDTSISNPTKS